MLVPEHAREMPVGRYREISGLSRDLVGRAVVLDGGAPGSGALGPVTLFQKASCLGGAGARARTPGAFVRAPPRRRRPCRPAVGRRAPPAPGRPPPAESSPRAAAPRSPARPPARGQHAPPAAAPLGGGSRQFLPSYPFSRQLHFSAACGCSIFPQSPNRTLSISCVWASLNHPLVC